MANLINLEAFNKFHPLETKRLLLREYQEEDLTFMNHIKSDPELLRYMDKTPHKSLDETKILIESIGASFNDKKAINWIITDKETQNCLGDIGIWRFDNQNASGEIGYTLSKDAWGKGYMTEALNAILDFGFEELNLHRIEANINPVNLASKKLLLKLNFQKEAYFKENYYFDGQFLDSEIYSLLKKWHVNSIK